MAYMRGPDWYVWTDGNGMHLEHANEELHGRDLGMRVPLDVFDQIVVMRWAQLRDVHKVASGGLDVYMREVARVHEGDGGADALRKIFGLPTVMDLAMRSKKMADAIHDAKEREETEDDTP